jgi:NlpC/P60 family
MAAPREQVMLAQKYGRQYGVDPRLLLAIGGHETQWGKLGAGRQGFTLGYGATDSGLMGKYSGVANQYRYGARTLASWGVHSLDDVLAGKARRWATDPAWEQGVASMYRQLGGGGGGSVSHVQGMPDLGAALEPARTAVTTLERPAQPDLIPLLSQNLGNIAQGFQPTETLKLTSQPLLAAWMAPSKLRTHEVERGWNSDPPNGIPLKIETGTFRLPRAAAGAVKLAREYLGTPYVWGGENPGGFDCSGLLQYVYAKQGVQIPRTTYDQFHAGRPVPKGRLRPGDAVFFTGSDPRGNLPGHVGIYIGQGLYIQSPRSGDVVKISRLSGRRDYRGARRYG